jgi:tetratricopeptide (TPR) repeat protein
VNAKAVAAYLRGRQAELHGDWRAALVAFRSAVEADPRAPALRVSLAEAHARTGDVELAEREARKALSLDPAGPSAADAHAILGKAAALRRRTADAERELTAAIDIQVSLAPRYPPGQAPYDGDLWRLLAQLQLDDGKAGAAERTLEDLARRRPAEGAAALRELGRVLAGKRDLDGAAALFRKAVAAERRDTEAWRRLAELETGRRRWDEARKAWEGLLREDSDDPEALVALGRLAIRAGDVPAARAWFDQATHVAPDEVAARMQVGFAWIEARRLDDALAVADEGFRATGDPRLLYVRGLALRELRRLDEAAAAFGAVRTGDPDVDLAALVAEASTLAQAGRGDAALALLDRAEATRPGDVRLVTTRAYVLERTGRAPEAVRLLGAALAAQPRNARLRFALGVAQDRAGDRAGAMATMQRILADDPDDADAANFVGYGWAEKGERLDEAERLVRRALEADPDNGSFLDSLGWIFFQRGDVVGAIATLERAEALSGPEPTVLEHLGDAYLRAGRSADAARAWRRAVTALEEGAEPDVPDQRAGLERKLRDLPGDLRPARR